MAATPNDLRGAFFGRVAANWNLPNWTAYNAGQISSTLAPPCSTMRRSVRGLIGLCIGEDIADFLAVANFLHFGDASCGDRTGRILARLRPTGLRLAGSRPVALRSTAVARREWHSTAYPFIYFRPVFLATEEITTTGRWARFRMVCAVLPRRRS